MAIRIVMHIKLPFFINVADEVDGEIGYSFDFSDFSEFNVTFVKNADDLLNEEEYDTMYEENVSSVLRVECVFNEVDYKKYHVDEKLYHSGKGIEIYSYKKEHYNKNSTAYKTCRSSIISTEEIEESEKVFYTEHVDVPEEETKNILSKVIECVNKITAFIAFKSRAFWIEEIPSNLAAFNSHSFFSYNFYSPESTINPHGTSSRTYSDLYQQTFNNDLVLNESYFKDFVSDKTYVDVYNKYINKCKKSLLEHKFEEVIIYGSIALEAFIEMFYSFINLEGDIVYNTLNSLNRDYIDIKFNVMLKHVYKKSLKEMSETDYTLIKRLYKIRNVLMHTGRLNKESLKKAGIKELNYNECVKIINSIQSSAYSIVKLQQTFKEQEVKEKINNKNGERVE